MEATKPRLIEQLIKPNGFVKRFFFHLQSTGNMTQAGAYEKTEEEHMTLFGSRKYSSYDSFRQIKNRLIRK